MLERHANSDGLSQADETRRAIVGFTDDFDYAGSCSFDVLTISLGLKWAFYLLVVSPTTQKLLRTIRSTSTFVPSWILLSPDRDRPQALWTTNSERFLSPDKAKEIARVVSQGPGSGQLITSRVSWAADLIRLLMPLASPKEDYVILPIFQEGILVACIGWGGAPHRVRDHAANAREIRKEFRHQWQKGRLQAENRALSWLVSRSDRSVACTTSGGAIVGANRSASDLLMNLQHGSRHFFHSNLPQLPKALALAIGSVSSGQIKLNSRCTARFGEIVRPSGCSPSLVGIEFFVEESTNMLQPLSSLTAVEREVYELMRAGLTNPEIAERRGCAFATVKNQVAVVLSKMGVSRRQHLLLPPDALHPVQLRNPGMKGSTVSIR
jgi:DNA-binding CsgD family transcriptional regulator